MACLTTLASVLVLLSELNRALHGSLLLEAGEGRETFAEKMLGQMAETVGFLLRTFPKNVTPISVLLTADGYAVGNAFRVRSKRHRLAVALTSGASASPFCTLCDLCSDGYYAWRAMSAQAQNEKTQRVSFEKGGKMFRVHHFGLDGGDHLELWRLFRGMGKSHRSCATLLADRLEMLHQRTRLSVQEMDAAGFACSISRWFEQPCYTITPALHDTKGMIRLLASTMQASKGRDFAGQGWGEYDRFPSQKASQSLGVKYDRQCMRCLRFARLASLLQVSRCACPVFLCNRTLHKRGSFFPRLLIARWCFDWCGPRQTAPCLLMLIRSSIGLIRRMPIGCKSQTSCLSRTTGSSNDGVVRRHLHKTSSALLQWLRIRCPIFLGSIL